MDKVEKIKNYANSLLFQSVAIPRCPLIFLFSERSLDGAKRNPESVIFVRHHTLHLQALKIPSTLGVLKSGVWPALRKRESSPAGRRIWPLGSAKRYPVARHRP